MKNWIGTSLIGIGTVHTVLGLVFFQPTLAELWAEGLFNTVNQQPMREACFWFLFGGVMMVILGAFIRWVEKLGHPLPLHFGWMLFALAAAVVFIMPISGGWLMFVPAIGIFLKKRKSVKATV